MENRKINETEVEKKELRQKSVFTQSSKQINPNAKPFIPPKRYVAPRFLNSREIITVGPSQVPVNAKIWKTIASTRVLPDLNPVTSNGNQCSASVAANEDTISSHEFIGAEGYPIPASYDVNNNQDVVIFRREFGPVATNDGIELRLKYGSRVIISLDGAVLVENGDIRVSVSSNGLSSAIEHPNGRVNQYRDHTDIVAYDGYRKNNLVRYSKIWKDCISLTAQGCALIYLVDTAGTRTTSDQVNRDWGRDFCKQIYMEKMSFRSQMETNYAANQYRYKVEEDGTNVFVICNVRIAQTLDGLIRIQADSFSIRTSVENRSLALKTPIIHCTASMGNSPHLFIRINDRRVHFDGTNFVVRNMGHSSSFDGTNILRIH